MYADRQPTGAYFTALAVLVENLSQLPQTHPLCVRSLVTARNRLSHITALKRVRTPHINIFLMVKQIYAEQREKRTETEPLQTSGITNFTPSRCVKDSDSGIGLIQKDTELKMNIIEGNVNLSQEVCK